MEDMEKAQKEYEIGVLVRKEEDLAEVRRFLEQHQAVLSADFQAKKIAFAYPIEHQDDGFFAFARFSSDPAGVPQIENDLRTERAVLRSLITVPPKAATGDAAGAGKKRGVAPVRRAAAAPSATPFVPTLSNEALEKKIEEMLQ